jgi:radical SAM protein with 4Fe4S-binding SPASM domain
MSIFAKLRRLRGYSDFNEKLSYHYKRKRTRFLTKRGRYSYRHYLARRSAYRHKRPLSYPSTVHLELTSHCNARCQMCPHHAIQRKGNMSWEMAEAVVKDWPVGKIDRASLFYFGEPLLYKRLPDIVALIKQHNPQAMTFITTNGQLLKPELAEELWKVGLDSMAVSYQGDEEEIHEQIMVGIIHKTVEENILAAEVLRRQINPRAVLKINSIIMPETSYRVDNIRRLWQERGITLELTPLHNEYRLIDPQLPFETIRNHYCPSIFLSAMVYSNGDVGFCCSDPDASLSIGNVSEQTLGNIWHGSAASALRQRHLRGDFSNEPICATCSYDLLRGPIY